MADSVVVKIRDVQFIPTGEGGGISPVVTITEIENGHRITITDALHPSGQGFDVLDGADGASAYAQAVAGGYEGTEAEFNEILANFQNLVDGANASELNAEAWAIGTKNGQDVPESDPTHENNAKYYAEMAIAELDRWKQIIQELFGSSALGLFVLDYSTLF